MSEGTPRTGTIRAAGAVLWRERGGRFEVALVHRPRYKDWSWPKGKLDPGEPAPVAAAREVAEETGTAVVLGPPLPALHYALPDGGAKEVHYWAARAADGRDAPALAARRPVDPASWAEIDDVVWVSAATAADLLTRPDDLRPLVAAQKLWSRGRIDTRVLAVVRHGRARRRQAWSGPEDTRPLTEQGRAQADALVPLLAAYGAREVVTSPWERCLHTVTPYAQATGLSVREAPALTEAAHAADPRASAAAAHAVLAKADNTVVSTHRPVLPAVLEEIAKATRRWTHGHVPSGDPYLRTGEALLVHVRHTTRGPRVVALERHRPSSIRR